MMICRHRVIVERGYGGLEDQSVKHPADLLFASFVRPGTTAALPAKSDRLSQSMSGRSACDSI